MSTYTLDMPAPTMARARATTASRSRWLALMVLCAGMLMIVLDATVVNVALPEIQNDLGFSTSGLAWVVNAYLIAFGGLLLLAGRLGDLLSRRGVFLVGLAVFTAASLACGLAENQVWLVVARFVQGVGGALTSAVILGMIVTLFPEPRERGRAIGVYGFVASAGGSVGLLAGGILTQAVNWHWIFFINVPVGLVTGVLAMRLLARDRGTGVRTGADAPGAALITGALMAGVYTIVGPAARYGWTGSRTLLFAGATLALLVGFAIREATAAHPLVPARILRSRDVLGANAVQALSTAGMFGMFFLGVLYLQRVLGYDALGVGLAFLPTTVVMGALSLRWSGALVLRLGARRTALAGLLLVAVGLALFARVPVAGDYLVDALPAMLVLGVGMGAAFPALTQLAMSGATEQDAGLASGLANTTNEVGAALGLAVLATLSATRSGALLGTGVPAPVALTDGYRLGLLVGAGLVVVAAALCATVIRPDHRRP